MFSLSGGGQIDTFTRSNLSEWRIAIYFDFCLSGLPAFLTEDHELNSGFMLAQITAAALASEDLSLTHPASVDNFLISAD